MYPREKLEADPRLIMARTHLLNKVKWRLLNGNAVDLRVSGDEDCCE